MAEREARPKVPKTKVDTTPDTTTGDGTNSPGEIPPGEVPPEAAGEAPSAARATESVRAWVHETFPGHEHAVTWGFVGFLVAILFFVIGFWRTLLVVLLVVVGVAFGQVLDGDPKIINTLRGILGGSGDNGR